MRRHNNGFPLALIFFKTSTLRHWFVDQGFQLVHQQGLIRGIVQQSTPPVVVLLQKVDAAFFCQNLSSHFIQYFFNFILHFCDVHPVAFNTKAY
jgi:hypothetical protein